MALKNDSVLSTMGTPLESALLTGPRLLPATFLLAVTLLGGCSEPSNGSDGGAGDSGTIDGGLQDAGSPDGGFTLPPWPSSPDGYTPELVSYLHTLTKPAKSGLSYTCCRDFGAISRDKIEDNRDDLDNAVSSFFDALGLLTSVNLQQQIDSNLQDGSLMLLLDHWGYRVADQAFLLASFDGSFEGSTSFAEAKQGTGRFLLSRGSFLPGTGTPRLTLDANISSAGELHASGDNFELTLGLFGAALNMKLGAFQLDATADETSNSIAYRRGKMSGYVEVRNFFGAINQYVETSCSCLGLTGPLFSQRSDGSWVGDCQADAAALCSAAAQGFCVTMGDASPQGSCVLTPQILPDAADLDLDPTQAGYEALSLGFQWDASPASVVGIE